LDAGAAANARSSKRLCGRLALLQPMRLEAKRLEVEHLEAECGSSG